MILEVLLQAGSRGRSDGSPACARADALRTRHQLRLPVFRATHRSAASGYPAESSQRRCSPENFRVKSCYNFKLSILCDLIRLLLKRFW